MRRRIATVLRSLDLFAAITVSPVITRRRARRPPVPGSTLVLPPVPPGGFGDQAVVNGARSAVAAIYPSAPFGIGAHRRGDASRWGADYATEVNLSSWFARPRLTGWVSLSRAALQFDRMMFIGTDVFDGSYSDPDCWVRVVRAAHFLGIETRVVSFSCSASPKAGAVRTLRRLPSATRLLSRDPLSQTRVESLLGRSVEPCADLAFLLRRSSNPPDLLIDRPGLFEAQGRRIGLNINPDLLKRAAGLTIEESVGAASLLVIALVREMKLSVILIPHDLRGQPNELALAHMIVAKVPASIAERCAISTARTAADVKTLTSSLDLVVTGRMHLAVAALGVATPVLCASYQDKVEGLFERCGVPELVFPPALFIEPSMMLPLITHAVKRAAEIQRTLRSNHAHLEQLALASMR
jgi:polysaccharide pyruvyl transferase WcaK-like protein